MNPTLQQKLNTVRQELLDMGLRNPLLNYRTLKARGVEVIGENPSDIYRSLIIDKKKMTFESKREELDPEQSITEAHQDESRTVESAEEEPPNLAAEVAETGKFADSKLQTAYSEQELERRLLNTYYFARTYIEEQGVNMLYLALGMLHWHEAERSEEPRKAPLILIPVELERVSARERFKLAYTEDEIGHNISLAAKMKAEFGLTLPELPEEGEPDIAAYFQQVGKAIGGRKPWFIDTRSVVIGFFSFGKFLMYHDLDITNWPESQRPEEHPVLKALLEDGFKEDAGSISESEPIDPHFNLEQARHVLDADSSQILAILDAKQGKNLVIQGPPGTGKSQTIANLIAEAIGEGKTILFVSEKMAALEVVKRRLDSVGLGIACLELHSHKTNKKDVLQELQSTLQLGKPRYEDNGDLQLLNDLRQRLNDYCKAIHTEIGESGSTPYHVLGELVRYRERHEASPFPSMGEHHMESWKKADIPRREALTEELQKLVQRIGTPVKHLFWGTRKKVMLPSDAEALKKALSLALVPIRELDAMLLEFSEAIGYPMPANREEAHIFLDMLQRALEAPDLTGMAIQSNRWLDEHAELTKWLEAGKAGRLLHDKYNPVLIPEAWNQDLLMVRQTLARLDAKWWRWLSGDYRKVKQQVLGLCRDPRKSAIPPLELTEAILAFRRNRETVGQYEDLAQTLFGNRCKGMESDWDTLGTAARWVIKLHEEVKQEKLPYWMFEFLQTLPDRTEVERQYAAINRLVQSVDAQLQAVETLLEFDGTQRFDNRQGLREQPYADLVELLLKMQTGASQAQEIASFHHLAEICAKEGLSPAVQLAEQWEAAGERLLDALRWNRYQSLVSQAFHERPALSGFDGIRHEQAVRKFRDLDRSLADLNRAKLTEVHWSKLPQHEAGGQLGVLRREFEKKTRHLPIRKLISKSGRAIQAIKPVFMMGPLSIATYLEPGVLKFDLVIFDEASQVKPVDAFGAIIRGKQAIVVGDSKQMPPSSFFDSIAREDEGDEENFVADMESILGLFTGQNAPQRMLRWHYRSRHESLITVSNHEFYEDKLVVFPSPDSGKRHSGLIYHHLADSHYDRGRTRTNRKEAQAVARAVVEHAKTHPELSLGVAAFSMAQMQAVMDELEKMRRSDPTLEAYFSAHPHEPFFVKNLENVQGDERDVILISIGYGKTKEGYLAMDFGPLNRDGGERRLNVLITRARIRCEVFTNLRSDDIDLGRSNAQGVRSLKNFLKYAESGILDIPSITGKGFDSPFEAAVYDSLIKLGYDVKPQVGSAGFSIDLAVVHPDRPGSYLLGIECDGATYHSARSARDRDRLRQEVLEGLGWRIHRIWSTDWFRHPERELRKAAEAIEEAKLYANLVPIALREPDDGPETDISRDEAASRGSEEVEVFYETAELTIHLGDREFRELPLSLIAQWIYEVVKVESPVHVNEVMKRICDALGIRRVGSRIQEAFRQTISHVPNVKERNHFLWISDMEKPVVRNRSLLERKKAEYIAEEEYVEAILHEVTASFGAEEEAVIQAVYQNLGFARVTEDMRQHVSAILQNMVKQRVLENNHELITASENS